MPSSSSRSLLALALSVTGCGGPTLAEIAEIAEQEVRISVSGVTSEPETAALGEPQGGLGVERAVVRAAGITLSACRENTADLTLAARSYDLLSEPRPAEQVRTAVNELCRLRVDVDATAADDVEDVPKDASLYVAGTDGSGEPIAWSSQGSFSLVFEAEGGRGFGREPLLLGFDLATWLESLPTPDGDAETFEAQLRGAAALYVDTDGDGALDDDEATPIAAATDG